MEAAIEFQASSPRPRILVVDDEPVVVESLTTRLEEDGFEVIGAGSGVEALALLLTEQPLDLMILDVGLPDTSGFEVCRRVRAVSDLPVIFLTAANELTDRLNGFDLGADDYVTKPVPLSEVTRRVQAVLRRSRGRVASSALLSGPGGLTLSPRAHEVHVGDVLVELTPREFSVLELLLERRGEVLSADAIALAVWGYATLGERNFVEAQLSRVRAKLAQAGAAEVVRTIRGVGYVIR